MAVGELGLGSWLRLRELIFAYAQLPAASLGDECRGPQAIA
jgi:hypothetical protein